MAGGQERILRRRIKSMQSTKKITRALELIAATRIAKAQARVQASRPYADQITSVIQSLASSGAGAGQPLLTPKETVRKVGFVVIAGDRGLAGAYNSSVIRMVQRQIDANNEQGIDYGIIAVGKKSEEFFRFRKYRIDAVHKGFSDSPSYENARAVAAEVLTRFEGGEYDRIELAYTQFLSAGSQRAVLRTFAPIDLGVADGGGEGSGSGAKAGYEFEPEPAGILASLLPRYAESRLYAAMLDAAASEHAARQRAMKSATENAGELIKKLSLTMNQARQASITTEIMEIVGGAAALAEEKGSASDLFVDKVENPDFFRSRTAENRSSVA
jgi:F-type H+-transporting ATPase subunit gamma